MPLIFSADGFSLWAVARRVMIAACFWTAVALIFVLPQLSQHEVSPGLLRSALAQWWSWGLLAPIIIAIDAQMPFSSQPVGWRLLTHFASALFFTVIYAYVSACMAAIMGVGAWSALIDKALLVAAAHGVFWSLLIYGLIVGVAQAYRYQQRYSSTQLSMERLQRNFSEARLHNLRMQLDPHFLFNALNTISAQVEREPKLARTMIEHLGDLLRLSLSTHRSDALPLAQELAFLDHYLAIQKIRFGENLRVHITVSADVEQALVPSMLLQPLVENAIRHGLSPRAGGGAITIEAARSGEALRITVRDDGVGLPAGGIAHVDGLGLAITRERIAGLYVDEPTYFSIHAHRDGGAEVEIVLPLRYSDHPHD